MKPMIDSHLDIAWNALSWNRDQTESLSAIRKAEVGLDDAQGRGRATVCLPELKHARVGICFATLLARAKVEVPTWRRTDLDFRTQEIACATALGQFEYYRLLEQRGLLRFLRTSSETTLHWQRFVEDPENTPLGCVLTMEGADPILSPDHLPFWWEKGLRLLGLAHYGESAYAVGTDASGPLTQRGPGLLKAMEEIGIILDLTHLSDPSFFQSLDLFNGRVHASHNNCRALVEGERQFSDEQLCMIIERDGVIGAVMDNWMLTPGWKLGETPQENVTIENVADHIDHICQLAGNARHAAIGSDLDGGFGTEQTPSDLETIFDLHKLETILAKRGYADCDISLVFSGNWLRFLQASLPPKS